MSAIIVLTSNIAQTQFRRRREFLERKLERDQATLADIHMEVGQHHPAAWMVSLVIAQFETELRWLGHVSHELAMAASTW